MKRSFALARISGLRSARGRIAWCMVGTAVYQVGCRVLEPVEEAQRVEAGRAVDRGAGRERGRDRGDQAVDVEQRHDVEAAVVGRQRQRGADVAGRGREVALQQRHDLGPRGRARGVQHQRLVVLLRRRPTRPARRRCPFGRQLEPAGRAVGRRRAAAGRPHHAAVPTATAGPSSPAGHDQRLGAQVGEVEVELLGPVGRVQGCRGGAAGDGRRRPWPSPARSAARSRPGRRGRCPSALSVATVASASSRRPPKLSGRPLGRQDRRQVGGDGEREGPGRSRPSGSRSMRLRSGRAALGAR